MLLDNRAGETLLFSGSATDPSTLAGTIAGLCREGTQVRVRSMGAGAVGQAIKACAIARTMLSDVRHDGPYLELSVVPAFETISVSGKSRSAMVLTVITVPL